MVENGDQAKDLSVGRCLRPMIAGPDALALVLSILILSVSATALSLSDAVAFAPLLGVALSEALFGAMVGVYAFEGLRMLTVQVNLNSGKDAIPGSRQTDLQRFRSAQKDSQRIGKYHRAVTIMFFIVYVLTCVALPIATITGHSFVSCQHTLQSKVLIAAFASFLITKVWEVYLLRFAEGELLTSEYLLKFLFSFLGFCSEFSYGYTIAIVWVCSSSHVASLLRNWMTGLFLIGTVTIQWIGLGILCLSYDSSSASFYKLFYMDTLAACTNLPDEARWVWQLSNVVRTFLSDMPFTLFQTIVLLYVKFDIVLMISIILELINVIRAFRDAIWRAQLAAGAHEEILQQMSDQEGITSGIESEEVPMNLEGLLPTNPENTAQQHSVDANRQLRPKFGYCQIGLRCGLLAVVSLLPYLHTVLWSNFATVPNQQNLTTCGQMWHGVYIPHLKLPDYSCWEPMCGLYYSKCDTGCQDGSDSFMGTGFAGPRDNYTSLADLPIACAAIVQTDLVNSSTASDCSSFCVKAFGSIVPTLLPFAPMCSITSTKDFVGKACSKVGTYQLSWLFVNSLLVLAFGAVYLVLGVLILMVAPLHDFSKVSQEDEGAIMRAPSSTPGAPATVAFKRGWHALPFCFLPCSTDAERARGQLFTKALGVVADPPLDVISVMSFLGHGQPAWALATFASVAWMHDPFQIRGLQSLRGAWRQGFATRELHEYQVREGSNEGPVGGTIALISVVISPLGALGQGARILRIISAGTSFALTMPGASQAMALLWKAEKNSLRLNDYYMIEEAIAQLSLTEKYGLATHAAALAAIASLSSLLHCPAITVACFVCMLLAGLKPQKMSPTALTFFIGVGTAICWVSLAVNMRFLPSGHVMRTLTSTFEDLVTPIARNESALQMSAILQGGLLLSCSVSVLLSTIISVRLCKSAVGEAREWWAAEIELLTKDLAEFKE